MIRANIEKAFPITEIRNQLYKSDSDGYYVFKNFITEINLQRMRNYWLNKNIDINFSKFIKNQDVTVRSPNYYYAKPNDSDRAYCCFLWNSPHCQITHEVAFEIQYLRNVIEDRPIYFGLNGLQGQYLQYRVCNSVSEGQIVYPHGDFIEMSRSDSAANHDFDPSRLQATLLLSSPEKDYSGDGFIMENNQGKELSFCDMGAKAGDLILWRYGNIHQVRGIKISGDQTGFMRIIYPTYELDRNRLYPETEGMKGMTKVGVVNNREIYQKKINENS